MLRPDSSRTKQDARQDARRRERTRSRGRRWTVAATVDARFYTRADREQPPSRHRPPPRRSCRRRRRDGRGRRSGAAARIVERHAAYLTRLDAVLGDGDHGDNLVIGFRAVDGCWRSCPPRHAAGRAAARRRASAGGGGGRGVRAALRHGLPRGRRAGRRCALGRTATSSRRCSRAAADGAGPPRTLRGRRQDDPGRPGAGGRRLRARARLEGHAGGGVCRGRPRRGRGHAFHAPARRAARPRDAPRRSGDRPPRPGGRLVPPAAARPGRSTDAAVTDRDALASHESTHSERERRRAFDEAQREADALFAQYQLSQLIASGGSLADLAPPCCPSSSGWPAAPAARSGSGVGRARSDRPGRPSDRVRSGGLARADGLGDAPGGRVADGAATDRARRVAARGPRRSTRTACGSPSSPATSSRSPSRAPGCARRSSRSDTSSRPSSMARRT